jgi:hypothetical protein
VPLANSYSISCSGTSVDGPRADDPSSGSAARPGSAIADLGGDGALDIAVIMMGGGGSDSTGSISVLFGGGARYAVTTVSTDAVTSRLALAIGDVDNDGRPDIVVSEFSNVGNDRTPILRNAGARQFTLLAPVATRRAATIALADLDRDGNSISSSLLGACPLTAVRLVRRVRA